MELAAHQRARGTLALSFKRRGAATVLDHLRQEGCLKARFPHVEPPDWPGGVTLNSAGGIAGGDRLSSVIAAGAGTAATVASQAAERVYRAVPGLVAEVSTGLHVAAGASLEWLPQETIFFDRCAIRRRLDIHLAADAWFLGVESLVFGRAAMREEVVAGTIEDRIRVHRAGRLVLHDSIRLHGGVAALLDRPAVLGGGRAMATLICASAEPLPLEALREAWAGLDAGASVFEGVLVGRISAANGAALRRGVVAGLNILRGGRRLPRVWQC